MQYIKANGFKPRFAKWDTWAITPCNRRKGSPIFYNTWLTKGYEVDLCWDPVDEVSG